MHNRVWKPFVVFPALAVLALPGGSHAVGARAARAPAQQQADAYRAPQEAATRPAAPVAAIPVPFGPGEEGIYQLKLGIFSAGEGRLSVAAVEDVRGAPSYRFEVTLKGGIPGARVNDQYWSWMDVSSLASRRYTRDIQEPFYDPPIRTFEIFPEENRWTRTDNGDTGPTKSVAPLDDISFLYWIRTMPLAVGETYENNRYFKENGNPVVIKVLRKERIEVPAGEFNTIVVQPIVKTEGLFKEDGRAEVYLSDDASRHVVYMRIEIPVIGSMTLHLKEFKPGTPLAASSAAARPGDGSAAGAVPPR
jgi:hypothetical protein